ncbi:hypothetical protein QUC31_000776 [Theobroma cacao]|uniref:Uncharacterized protein LOC18592097 n=2 Tax=Theobroma cacao TaxID=3641 RepID=A0AB32UVL8_THECC|nr:PREDICTED: uncharacterized protein LOC18592097 [Theobroma cacao]EOY15914.1 Uncharacterized protein TCM_034837 [Theobroma cacao]WRX29783.1 hypothetical protein QQP08_022270 [Theobroma cacao]
MSTSGSILPCKAVCFRMASSKSQPAILCFSHLLVISKQKGKHQILRNHQKLQSLGTSLRVPNSDRYRNMVVCSGVGSGPPIPSDPSPGSWKPWILGMLFSIILPFWRGKWGPLLKLKDRVETVIDTVETVTDIIEEVAEQVEKVADKVGDQLPEGRLKDALEFVEDIAEETADDARLAGEFIDKVEDAVDDVEKQVESFFDKDEKAEETKEDDKGHD